MREKGELRTEIYQMNQLVHPKHFLRRQIDVLDRILCGRLGGLEMKFNFKKRNKIKLNLQFGPNVKFEWTLAKVGIHLQNGCCPVTQMLDFIPSTNHLFGSLHADSWVEVIGQRNREGVGHAYF